MKNIYLIVLLFTIAGSGNAQPYQSCFGKKSTRWNIAYRGGASVITEQYGDVGKKEIFNGMEVYKLGNSYSYLREDTLTGRLWLYNWAGKNKEYLIMDLSMAKGDTFYFEQGWNRPKDAIIDSIYYDEQNRKILLTDTRLELDSINYCLKFIEGIGPNIGFTYPTQPEFNQLLLCLYKDDTLSYKTNRFGGKCEVWTDGIKNKKINTNRVKIRNDQYRVEIIFNEKFKGDISLINMSGKIVKTIQAENLQNISFYIDILPPGTYLVQITDKSKLFHYSEKIIKH